MKEATEEALRIEAGSAFHNFGATREKAPSPKQARLDLGTRMVVLVLERRALTGAAGDKSEEIYGGER